MLSLFLERFTLGLRTIGMNLEGSETQRGLARSVLANVPVPLVGLTRLGKGDSDCIGCQVSRAKVTRRRRSN